MKRKILIIFPSQLTSLPVTYNLVKKYDLKINILRATIKYNVEGNLFLEIDGTSENIENAIRYLEDLGAKIDLLNKRIHYDNEVCVHCGACTAICSSGALSFDEKSYKIIFDEEKCIGCELCIKACPAKAISGSI